MSTGTVTVSDRIEHGEGRRDIAVQVNVHGVRADGQASDADVDLHPCRIVVSATVPVAKGAPPPEVPCSDSITRGEQRRVKISKRQHR